MNGYATSSSASQPGLLQRLRAWAGGKSPASADVLPVRVGGTEYRQTTTTPASVLADRIAAGGLLAALRDGTLAAFVMFRPLEDSLYLEQIDVAPTFEGRRIGAALIDAVAERAASAGLARLTLSTFRDVPWNAPYYRRLGFVDIADVALSDALLTVRREHEARGLDERARLFMRRPV